MSAYGWETLETQTPANGSTAVSWTVSHPVADPSNAVAMLARNGVQPPPSEIAVSTDGLIITYTPAYPFETGDAVWGRYVGAETATPDTPAAEAIIDAAMVIFRRRSGIDTTELPDAGLYAETSMVLAMYLAKFDCLNPLGDLSESDRNTLAMVLGLNTTARLLVGILFGRVGGAKSIKDRNTAIAYGDGDPTGDMFLAEAKEYFGLLTCVRAARAEFAAGHSPFGVSGKSRVAQPYPWLFWRNIFDEMFFHTFPFGFPVAGWTL